MKISKIYCPTERNSKINLLNNELKNYGISIIRCSLNDRVVHKDYKESAKLKATRSFNETGKPTLAMEVGLEINGLGGWPHTNIAYEIEHLQIHRISDMVANLTDRTFTYGIALAFLDSYSGSTKVFEHGFSGEISPMPTAPSESKEMSALDSIMIPVGYTKPISSLDAESLKEFRETYETAFKEFGEWFKETYGKSPKV